MNIREICVKVKNVAIVSKFGSKISEDAAVVITKKLVDNNSKDGSQEFIKSNYSEIKLFAEKDNLGFGKANNLGVNKAIGENILLLNNDTILLNDIKPVIEESKKKSFTCQVLLSCEASEMSFGSFRSAPPF